MAIAKSSNKIKIPIEIASMYPGQINKVLLAIRYLNLWQEVS